MVLLRFPLSRSLIFSTLFHGALFILAGISLQNQYQEIKTLTPKGIMLEMGNYQATGTISSAATTKTTPKVTKVVPNSPFYHKKNQPHPEVKESESQAHNNSNQLGNATYSTGATGPLGDPNGVEAKASERYLYELKLMLEQRKIYPGQARMMGQTGKVIVRFVVHKDGSIDQAEIVEPSPFSKLNEAALKLIQNVKQFKPIPTELGKEQWTLNVPIHYSLN